MLGSIEGDTLGVGDRLGLLLGPALGGRLAVGRLDAMALGTSLGPLLGTTDLVGTKECEALGSIETLGSVLG